MAVVGVCCAATLLLIVPVARASCPNEAFRTGPSAQLPDCRAYELVSPQDTRGRLLRGIEALDSGDLFPTEPISSDGASVLYLTFGGPLAEPGEASGTFDLYRSQRTATGWETGERLSPSGSQAVLPDAGGVDPTHRYAFTHAAKILGEPGGSFAAEGGAGYLRSPGGTFELIGIGSLGSERLAQGQYISPGGEHVVFSTGGFWCKASDPCPVNQLETSAPPTGTPAVYDRSPDGPTQVVSLLPGDVPLEAGHPAIYQGVSADGSVVAFKVDGGLYVRADDSVTEEVTSEAAVFAGLSNDGGKLVYVAGGDIHEFDVADEVTSQVNSSGDAGVVNVSADGSHIYFTSPSQLDGSAGTLGQPNLYVWTTDSGSPRFIATVLPSDLEHTSGVQTGYPALANWTDWVVTPDRSGFGSEFGRGPGADSSRTTPDGTVLAFESRAQLTGYSNDGHTEIYRYDASDESLDCVSCSPLASPASVDARFQSSLVDRPPAIVHNLSDDGSRVFFETAEALVSADTDGVNDVYEWHRGEQGGPVVDLISSGKSTDFHPLTTGLGYVPDPNAILGITPDGSSVAFITQDQLLPDGPGGGGQAIYVARIGGGFPGPPAPPTPCTGEACRSQLGPAPSLATPWSNGAVSQGNVKSPRRRCRHPHKGVSRRHHGKKRRCHQVRHRRGGGG